MSVMSFVSLVPSVSFALTRTRRQRVFLAVGSLGFLVQLAALAALMSLAHWNWLPATVVSVELAVVHNFLWHERWTWGDRRVAPAHAARSRLALPYLALSHLAPSYPAFLMRLARFHAANGVVSIVGNAALMTLFVSLLGLPAIAANALAVAAMSVVNFVMADRWVFGPTCFLVLLALAIPIHASAAPAAETLIAWQRHVAATEARLDRTRASAARGERSKDGIAAWGESLHVPSGTISDWRGSVFIPGVTLDRLLDHLQHPGTPPPQEDVVSSRVIARGQDSLSVAIRLVRHAIVTVSYDTEHEMRFRRWTPTLATARSVATRIEEVDGGDHGFLWRLHSYWRYEETDAGVQVELESLTLSRDVPSLVRPVAAPLVNRIARESVVRTLEALRAHAVGKFASW